MHAARTLSSSLIKLSISTFTTQSAVQNTGWLFFCSQIIELAKCSTNQQKCPTNSRSVQPINKSVQRTRNSVQPINKSVQRTREVSNQSTKVSNEPAIISNHPQETPGNHPPISRIYYYPPIKKGEPPCHSPSTRASNKSNHPASVK